MISPIQTTKISLRALAANRMRSALTVLGIVIGVTAVIVMFAVGTGAREEIAGKMSALGSNMLFIRPNFTPSSGARTTTVATLTVKDGEAIEAECSAVMAVAPTVTLNAQIIRGNANWSTRVTGTTKSLLTVKDWSITSGREFTGAEERNSAKVCILGVTVVKELFQDQDPVGQSVRIGKIPFTVIGVLEEKGESMMGDEDDTVLIPFNTARKRLSPSRTPGAVGALHVKSFSPERLVTAERQITELLRQRHRIKPGEDDDFRIRNVTQMVEATKSATAVMTMLLTAVASVSLLVGGIGIMNIMLVSVTERTREIGIRMAVGATATDIRIQFMTEALILSLIGGLTGVALGLGGATAITALTGWNTSVPIVAVILAVGVSAATGVFFGYYPASKAAALSPIEALRHE